jgi:hypothetical protein
MNGDREERPGGVTRSMLLWSSVGFTIWTVLLWLLDLI